MGLGHNNLNMRLLLAVLLAGVTGYASEPVSIPPFEVTVELNGQPLRITLSGTLTAGAVAQKQQQIQVDALADLSDFQQHITEVLRPGVNQNNRCGLRMTLESAELTPSAPDALLTARVHAEKYACAKALGRQMVTRLIGGDGTVTVRLTPQPDGGESLKLAGEVVSVQADGALGDLLQSEPAGPMLREKLRDGLAGALQKSLNKLKAELPGALRGLAAVRSAHFENLAGGHLGLALAGEVQIDAGMAQLLIGKLKEEAH
jgi:hypothetical protein